MQDGRAPRIKNRAPAAIQVTAEQLLRDAQERQESQFRAPKQRVEDFEELHEYRGRKREEFEKRIRQTRSSMYVILVPLSSNYRQLQLFSRSMITPCCVCILTLRPEKSGCSTPTGRYVHLRLTSDQ